MHGSPAYVDSPCIERNISVICIAAHFSLACLRSDADRTNRAATVSERCLARTARSLTVAAPMWHTLQNDARLSRYGKSTTNKIGRLEQQTDVAGRSGNSRDRHYHSGV